MFPESNRRSYIAMKVKEKSRGAYVYIIRLVKAFFADVEPYNPSKSISNSSLPHIIQGHLTYNVLQG